MMVAMTAEHLVELMVDMKVDWWVVLTVDC